ADEAREGARRAELRVLVVRGAVDRGDSRPGSRRRHVPFLGGLGGTAQPLARQALLGLPAIPTCLQSSRTSTTRTRASTGCANACCVPPTQPRPSSRPTRSTPGARGRSRATPTWSA